MYMLFEKKEQKLIKWATSSNHDNQSTCAIYLLQVFFSLLHTSSLDYLLDINEKDKQLYGYCPREDFGLNEQFTRGTKVNHFTVPMINRIPNQ